MQPAETKKIVEVLQNAIQTEVEGKEFYQQASQQSVFQALADEEDTHQWKFQEIYDTLKEGQAWPAAEERGHFLALLDYYEYLNDPTGWFVMKEHRLDGVQTGNRNIGGKKYARS